MSSFYAVSTFHLKARWNLHFEQSHTKGITDIEEIEGSLVYRSSKHTENNWIKEEPKQNLDYSNYKSQKDNDYYPEKEIREYLEAHPYIVQNYLFETSLRNGYNIYFICIDFLPQHFYSC